MTEFGVPQNWHAIVSSDTDSMISYLDHYRAMNNPSLQPLPGEGPNCARLCSSTFSGLADYEDVLTEARELAEILTGVLRTRQNVAQLSLKHIVGVFADGSSKNFPPYGRSVSFRIIAGRPMSFIKRDEVIETFETSVVLFALRTTNPYVREVLRESTRSQDWSNLYRVMETIILDLNENDPMQKKDGRRQGRTARPPDGTRIPSRD